MLQNITNFHCTTKHHDALHKCCAYLSVFCRPNWEGGRYDGDDATRFETLRLAMELGVDYVDIELKVCLHIGNFLLLTIL